jgi:hypothetical protein
MYIGQFDELIPGQGYPSMKTAMREEEYDGTDAIVKYLDEGKVVMAAPKSAVDVFTGEMIAPHYYMLTDGEYEWSSALSYYVKKYHLILPEDFKNKIVNQ